MHSSYNIIKSTVIESDTIVSTPVREKIYEKIMAKDEKRDESTSSNTYDELARIYDQIQKEAKNSAEIIIKDAESNARQMLDKALNQGEQLKEKAKDEGYQEGYSNGYKEGYDFGINESKAEAEAIIKEAQEVKNNADEVLKNARAEVDNFINNSSKDIIKLSVEIARQILGTELTVNQEAIYKLAEKVISNAVDKKQVILKVNPYDFNLVKARKEELSVYVEDSNNLFIVGDPSVKQGNIIADTSAGIVDGRIDTQLDMVLKGLLGD